MQANLMDKTTKTQSQIGYYHVSITTKHKDANVMPNSNRTYYASATIHTMQSHQRDPIPHSQYCNDRYSTYKIQEKTRKYQGLIDAIKAKG
jgi:hypothetical protein